MAIDLDDVRAFATRRWDLAEAAKREHIAERHRADPTAHWRSVDALREHLRTVRPEWPTPEDLASDLADLVALKKKIDRAAQRFTRR